jgi:hypothetical protein
MIHNHHPVLLNLLDIAEGVLALLLYLRIVPQLAPLLGLVLEQECPRDQRPLDLF